MKWWRWSLFFVPGVFGLVVGIWLNLADLPNPVVYLRAQLSAIIFIFGMILLVLGAAALVIWYRWQIARLDIVLESADDRRRFLRRLDHELKNPLTAIMAGLANLSANSNPPGAQTETLESVGTQVRRLSRLVADLRKLSELETRPLEMGAVDMNELLEQAFLLAQEHPGSAQRQLNLSIPRAPWPLPTLIGDRDLLFLTVHNLLDNALKFTRSGDTVEMRAFEDGANVVVEVADTGPGIPEGEMPHVWEELYRGEGARGVAGSGLGLALVRAIVIRHGGQVTLRSRPDQGTVFTVRLPVGEIPKA
jgi:two-component system, OmpR family, sensor kinase